MMGRDLVLLVICALFIAQATCFIQQIPNITQVITGYGYPVEIHFPVTSDGYVLTMHRIPRGRATPATKGPVLLQHGLTDSSAGWCLNSPSESLAYILADAGYDVWLGNNRGNGYSMNNINYGPSDPRFWQFSWDEMAIYDFPTQIGYVLNTTNKPKLSYIGHSEGTIQAFAGLVKNPALADKLNIYIGLAPVAYVYHLKVELLHALADLDADEILVLLGVHEFYLPTAIHRIIPDACIFYPGDCNYAGNFLYGPDSYLNQTRLDYYTVYEPFPTSVQNIIHWAQGVRKNTFQMFDYGTAGNQQHYGQPTPPLYDLTKFPNVPTALFTGGIDGLADVLDVQTLLSQLPVRPQVFARANYGHLDPLIGDQAYSLTYPSILTLLSKYN